MVSVSSGRPPLLDAFQPRVLSRPAGEADQCAFVRTVAGIRESENVFRKIDLKSVVVVVVVAVVAVVALVCLRVCVCVCQGLGASKRAWGCPPHLGAGSDVRCMEGAA